MMVGPNDIDLYSDEHVARFLQSLSNNGGTRASSHALVNGSSKQHRDAKNLSDEAPGQLDGARADADVSMVDAAGSNEEADDKTKEAANRTEPVEGKVVDGESKQVEGNGRNANTNGNNTAQPSGKDGRATSPLHKEQAGAAPPASEAEEPSFVHPIFLPPFGAKADRDMGIPENEAEDVRRLLALYVQKQEEVTRGARRLHEGLLRADRLRGNVLHWAKAEAHCGPNRDMSDGEDWYDKEAWGLVEDLKKGQDEEEEDTTTTGKKTRNRRT
jgi:hypothetical protein